jgi:anti-sigma factor RsiW
MECDRVAPLVSPLIDGELAPAEQAAAEAHLAGCAACREAVEAERLFSARLRAGATRHAAPPGLRGRVTAAVAAESLARSRPRPREWMQMAAAMLIGAVIASGTTWQIASNGERREAAVEDAISSHIRSLMAGHLTDVASSDQHSVKPWFNGRIDLSPPVADFTGDGYPLVGGRLDYVEGKPAAALVYRHRQHVINLFVTAAPDQASTAPASLSRQGFNVLSWRAGGMEFRAVSDLNAAELRQFEELVRNAGG